MDKLIFETINGEKISKRGLLIEYDSGYVTTEKEISQNFLIENHLGKEELYVNGIPKIVFAVLGKYGVRNNNNRIYSEEILKREAQKYLSGSIAEKTSWLEVNHPESAQINLLNLGGILIDCWWEGITLLGKIRLNLSRAFVDTGGVYTSGDNVANAMMIDGKLGVSSRGLGSLKKQGDINVVQPDYDLICWDFVSQPSSRGSWVGYDSKDLKPYVEEKAEDIKIDLQKSPQSFSPSNKNKFNDRLEAYLAKYK